MMLATVVSTLQFFRVVKPVPRLMRGAFVVVTAGSAIRLLLSPDGIGATLLPVLLLQMFAVSTGFMGYARRGHFDLLFTRGAGRIQVAGIYWLLSALPGVICWLVLATIELVWHRTAILTSSGTLAVVLCVSMLPWALSVPLTRFSGATGWLLVLAMTVALTPAGTAGYGLWQTQRGEPWWWSAVGFLVFPARLVGESATVQGLAPLAILVVVVAVMAGAFAWVWRSDVPLEMGQ